MTRSDGLASFRIRRQGFTLIELLVALIVGAIVLLGGRLMLDGVAEGQKRLAHASQRSDTQANAEQLLRRTVATLEVGTDVRSSFGGDGDRARFTSWCDTPGGWQERCVVTLTIADVRAVDGGSRASLMLSLAGTDIPVRTGLSHAALRYLLDAHGSGTWMQQWEPGLSAPLAIAALIDTDTLIFRVGTP